MRCIVSVPSDFGADHHRDRIAAERRAVKTSTCLKERVVIQVYSSAFARERQMAAQAKIPATLIPGDGIGPEIVDGGARRSSTPRARRSRGTAGGGHGRRCARPATRCRRSRSTSIRQHGLALKGPLTTPVGGGFRSSNVRLREEFDLYANLRPARTLVPGGRYENIDLVLVRENLEGLYVGLEHYIADRRRPARGGDRLRREHARRLPPHRRFAFDYAVKHKRKKVTHRAQGERAEGADRPLPRDRARGREAIRGQGSSSTTGSSTPARCSSC